MMWRCELHSSEPVAGFCEYGNESWGLKKTENVLTVWAVDAVYICICVLFNDALNFSNDTASSEKIM
jgi:hypothetical protein